MGQLHVLERPQRMPPRLRRALVVGGLVVLVGLGGGLAWLRRNGPRRNAAAIDELRRRADAAMTADVPLDERALFHHRLSDLADVMAQPREGEVPRVENDPVASTLRSLSGDLEDGKLTRDEIDRFVADVQRALGPPGSAPPGSAPPRR